ncbi:ubiquitin carboxyl-terminal hydrolase [Blyttiomyces helicus]|uniref:ubiquitinyl hydrolase 1 n=1 Tax=Blyttiomyces helicus TaxID=388810 RepID=A0A4P9W4P8_9FUNG|nr:ubiquitin carboxyl-terminal hydrolase [Blyttiomyces helicus]|eukprot:RKO87331.1 ubiquitin carboxyl-terminal hydrolase [Blyttiomyces helicus]
MLPPSLCPHPSTPPLFNAQIMAEPTVPNPDAPRKQADITYVSNLEGSPWRELESDPGIFNALVAGMCVAGVAVREVFSLDPNWWKSLGEVFGFIFLFQWKVADDEESAETGEVPKGLFFMNQVIENTCATAALVQVLMNAEDSIDLGPLLDNFKRFTEDFSPAERGRTLNNSQALRILHNSFARETDLATLRYYYPEDLGKKTKKAPPPPVVNDEDAPYHFSCFVPFDGKVYELDGLKRAPIVHGIGYNIMAVIRDPRLKMDADKAEFTELVSAINERIASLGAPPADAMVTDTLVPTTRDEVAACDSHVQLAVALAEVTEKLLMVDAEIRDDSKTREEYKADNTRRRFNYAPFLRAMIEKLQKAGLMNQVDWKKE